MRKLTYIKTIWLLQIWTNKLRELKFKIFIYRNLFHFLTAWRLGFVFCSLVRLVFGLSGVCLIMCVAECFDFMFVILYVQILCLDVPICDLMFLCEGVLIRLSYLCVLISDLWFYVCIFASSPLLGKVESTTPLALSKNIIYHLERGALFSLI